MSDTHKTARVRSPSYPYLDLEAAIERMRQMESFAKRSEVLVSVMVSEWGYKKGNIANGMKAVAALKGYGLISDSGVKEMRKIVLTDEAYQIVHGVQDSQGWKDLIKQCALLPAMYNYMWEKYGELENMPQPDVIKSHLIIDKKFNESAVGGFLRDYLNTISYAKLGKSDIVDDVSDDYENDETLNDMSESQAIEQAHELLLPPRQSYPQEKQFMQNVLSQSEDNPVSFRLLVEGKMGVNEIGKLIKLLEVQKILLED